MRSIILASFQSITSCPHHCTSPHLTSVPAQEDVLSEGPGPRGGEKEGKRTRTRGEVEESKTGVKRNVEGGNQRRRKMQKSGDRKKQKRGQEKSPLREASPSFYLSNLKLESKAIYQKRYVFSSPLRFLWIRMRRQK